MNRGGGRWIHGPVVVALTLLLVVVVFDAGTLLRAPPVYSDEPWIASEISSFVHGTGLRPPMFAGSGLYDHAQDIWNPYLGTALFMLVAVFAKASLLAYRLAAFLIGIAALGVFGAALRRFGWAITAAGTAALAASWGFFTASHYVRWDSLAFLILAVVLALLWRGQPGRRTALGLGLVLGAGFDVQLSVLAVLPGVVVLVGWERRDRWMRLLLLGASLGALLLAYVGVHYLSEPGEASRQYHLLLAPTYDVPLLTAVTHGDLGPLLSHEVTRYHEMAISVTAELYGPYGSLLTLGLGLLAALAMLPALTTRYPRRVVPAVLLLSYIVGVALIQGNSTTMYGWYALPLAIAAVVALTADRVTLTSLAPAKAMGLVLAAILCATGVVAIVVSVLPAHVEEYGLRYVWYALPIILVAILSAIAWIRAPAGGALGVGALLALAVAGLGYAISDVAKTPQPVRDPRLVASFHRLVSPSDVVLAEPIFWWLDPNPGFRANSVIWLDREVHHWSPAEAIHHICPNVIVLDDIWRSRYDAKTAFPTLAPSDPREGPALAMQLAREYRVTGVADVPGDRVVFWHRRRSSCPSS